MGKSSLIIVLGMSIIIAFFILRLNANSTESVAGTMNMFEQTHARLIANSGVEIYLEKFKWDRSLIDIGTFNNNNLFNGTYILDAIWDVDADSILRVTSTSSFMGVKHTSIAEAWATVFDVQFPPGALYLSSDVIVNNTKYSTKGNITIDGRDHYIDGVLKEPVEDYPQVPAIAVDSLPQQVSVIDYYNENTSATLIGLDGTDADTLSIEVVKEDFDWAAYAQDLADNPDTRLIPPVLTNTVPLADKAPWGRPGAPEVTFINGDVKLDSRYAPTGEKVLRGCGILVINGNLQINAEFEFVGLVIAYRETGINIDSLNLALNATGTIIGALVITGDLINLNATNGNFKILYSKDALNNVEEFLMTERWNIISWWE